jgi:hypothetical protein
MNREMEADRMEITVVAFRSDFDRLLAESVDEGFIGLLGDSVKQALYNYWERDYSIAREEIPMKLNEFGTALENTFGSSSRTVSKTIAKKLYAKLGIKFVEKPEFSFLEYVKEAKTKQPFEQKPLWRET